MSHLYCPAPGCGSYLGSLGGDQCPCGWKAEACDCAESSHQPLTQQELSAAMEEADYTYEPTRFARVIEGKCAEKWGVELGERP